MLQRSEAALTREQAQIKYNRSRHNLVMMLLFTVVNLVLLVLDSGLMFLFSASIPYVVVTVGIVSGFALLRNVSLVIAAILLGLYLLCWRMSKKHYGWIIAALVLFALDTLFMLGFYLLVGDFSGILDILFHVWVLYYLFLGAKYGRKLQKWPEEEPFAAGPVSSADTVALRTAQFDPAAQVLGEAEWMGSRICCRRSGGVDELIVNGSVLAESPAEEGRPLLLSAVKDGSTVTVLMDATRTVYITVDGETVASFAGPV